MTSEQDPFLAVPENMLRKPSRQGYLAGVNIELSHATLTKHVSNQYL